MIVAQDQEDNRYFTDKLSGRTITILHNTKTEKQKYYLEFRDIKKQQIITHNTHLAEYCETN